MATPNRYLVDKNLYDWLKERDKKDFPKIANTGDTYLNRYDQARIQLTKKLKEVEKRALLIDVFEKIEKGEFEPDHLIYLNNHGANHVAHVIDKASDLLIEYKCKLTAYEGYLLLMAIQFHDVGIYYGRKNHNTKCFKIMRELGAKIDVDMGEQKQIVLLAATHGGKIKKDRDTISLLDKHVNLMGQWKIRITFLAAILRIADELADDSTRTYYRGKELDDLPNHSKIYHCYSAILQPVIIGDESIYLKYNLTTQQIGMLFEKAHKSKTGTISKKTYLVDEIYERTWKMFSEVSYCNRFLRPYININSIRVSIEIDSIEDVLSDEELLYGIDKIEYLLEESGHPGFKATDIFSHCPALKESTGGKIMSKHRKKIPKK